VLVDIATTERWGMSNDVVIRDLRSPDVDAVVEIAVAAWAPIFAFYRQTMGDDLFAAANSNWKEEKARQVREACDLRNPALVWVAEKGGRVVGFVTFYANDTSRIGEIGNNAVHPDHQGMGIGTRMYQHVFGRLRKLGVRFVKVSTGGDPAHAAARRAYEKAGFSIQLPGIEYYRKL